MMLAQLTFDPAAAGTNVGIAGLTQRILAIEVFVCFAVLGFTALR
jgi:hypothetical protein